MPATTRFVHVPERDCRPTRRQFLRSALGAAAVAAAFPADLAQAATPAPSEAAGGPRGGRRVPGAAQDERFWELVKTQFPLRPGLVLLNAANLCPAPYPVLEAVHGHARDVDADASFQNRGKFNALAGEAREALARYLGATSNEVVITRNTSEGNNIVINGLDLRPGDEVVIWDQNHPTNNVAWDVRARRLGFTVKRIATPPAPADEEQLYAPFAAALTGRTRVLAFSEISNTTGVALPARRLAALARDRGILTLVDGAQTFGFRRADLHTLGFDFYTGSAHKWFTGPKEAGVLYVRAERIGMLWPSIVGVGWRDVTDDATTRLGTLGQRNDANVAAVIAACAFRERIGQDRAETRIRALVAALREGIAKAVPGARFHTPAAPELSGGVLVVALPGVDPRRAFEVLYRDHAIGAAAMGGELAGLRLCPSIYNTMAEVERVVEAVGRVV